MASVSTTTGLLGKRPLRKARRGDLRQPRYLQISSFALCWANHPWFTTWKGFGEKPTEKTDVADV